MQKAARERATKKAADARGGIRNPGIVTYLLNIEMASVIEIFWQPEEEEVPSGIAHKLGKDKSLNDPKAKELTKAHAQCKKSSIQ